MCTLTYIPLTNNNFILTSNRDEKHERKSSLSPQLYSVNGIKSIYPKDLEKGGTWIVMAENCYTLCLFNGASKPHTPLKSYKRSRGLLLLDFFSFNNINQFVMNIDFKGIEPFTLVIIQYNNQVKLFEIVWNGKQINVFHRNAAIPHIWSSVMIYDSEIRKHREIMFENFIIQNDVNTFEDSILKFHKNDDLNDKKQNLIIKSEIVSTVSITQIVKCGEQTKMKYFELKNGKKSESVMDLPTKNKNTLKGE